MALKQVFDVSRPLSDELTAVNERLDELRTTLRTSDKREWYAEPQSGRDAEAVPAISQSACDRRARVAADNASAPLPLCVSAFRSRLLQL